MMPSGGITTITAIVHSSDGIRFVTTGLSRDAVAARLACYVRDRSADVLSANAAREVHMLLRLGDIDAAIAAYFNRVGERWEEEHLELFVGERRCAYQAIQQPTLIDARR